MAAVTVYILVILSPWPIAAVGIVELFEWRFDDIALECENFLGPKGFEAVQVSPVAEPSIRGNSTLFWDRYEPVSYIIKSRSGGENEFEDMCQRCHKAGIKIYVEVVINNMARGESDPFFNIITQPIIEGLAGSEADLIEKHYPAVPYTAANFNKCNSPTTFYNNASWIKNCEFLNRHDLNLSQPYVRKKVVEFLNRLVELGASGFFVYAARYMWPDDLKAIYSQLKNTIYERQKPFIYHDYRPADSGTEHPSLRIEEYFELGPVTEYTHSNEMNICFNGYLPLKWFSTYGTAFWGLQPSKNVISFIDNKDNQREHAVLGYFSPKLYKMATAFTLAWGYGTPRIMSSYDLNLFPDCQGPPIDTLTGRTKRVEPYPDVCTSEWICEHRWFQISGMIEFANVVMGTEVSNFWDNGNNQISFCRGRAGFIAFNLDSYDFFERLQTCLPQGTYCDIATGYILGHYCSGRTVEVAYDGTALIFIGHGADDGFLAIHLYGRVEIY